MRLGDATWRDVGAATRVGRSIDGVLTPLLMIPVGSTEQHGPHLPLATDTLIAEEIAGPVLLAQRGLELLVREQASLDQELAERTPVRVVVGFVERLVHEDPLPRLSARIGRRGIPRRG